MMVTMMVMVSSSWRQARGACALARRLPTLRAPAGPRGPAAALLRRGAASSITAEDADGPQPMSRFGPQRLELAKQVALVLDEMPSRPRYFLENGTLLGE